MRRPGQAFDALAVRRRGVATSLDDAGSMAGDAFMAIEIVDLADDPETALARCEGFSHLNQALAALPAALRECLVLRELEGFAYKEIAQITGVPTGTVMSRLWRARKALLHLPAYKADFSRAPKFASRGAICAQSATDGTALRPTADGTMAAQAVAFRSQE